MVDATLLSPEQCDARFLRRLVSGEWYILMTSNAGQHLGLFIEIEDAHYLGKASKDFALLVILPTVVAFMRKSRMTQETLATHLGLQAHLLQGKDLIVLTEPHPA